ncbi:MAG: hypothetical protein KIT00_05995 [Rhodospirillales bacterium]|nr:hypothetical protein [Rhodospirillales bacterium]
MTAMEHPIPPLFDPNTVGTVWRVPYQEIAAAAADWADTYGITPAGRDSRRVCLLLIDVQNTFCIPGYELFVGGRSGTGAVDDNLRLCQFIYRNLSRITSIAPTLDTHQAMQIFHAITLIDENGRHPDPHTLISTEDVARGKWAFNPAVNDELGLLPGAGQRHLEHYVARLQERGKYDLTIWPYHAMLGGIGHALVAAVEQAVFFHGMARVSQPRFHIKGNHPLTEHYSVLGPEVAVDPVGAPLTQKNEAILRTITDFDAVVIAGQAKSHCVAWTVSDLLRDLRERDRALAGKLYLLEDCTSPVVVPGVIDFTDLADQAFAEFADAGMHIVRSTDPMHTWPGFGENG